MNTNLIQEEIENPYKHISITDTDREIKPLDSRQH